METKTAVDSGVCVLAKEAGIVESSESNRIVVREEDGNRREYILTKFARTTRPSHATTRDQSCSRDRK